MTTTVIERGKFYLTERARHAPTAHIVAEHKAATTADLAGFVQRQRRKPNLLTRFLKLTRWQR